MGGDQQSRTTPSWTIDVPDVRTVKVSSLPLAASVSDIEKFFSFSGHIVYVEMRSESEMTQVAYVTFNDAQAVDTALLLSGSMIIDDHVVTVTPVENYQLPPEATNFQEKSLPVDGSIRKTEEVVSTMLAKGYVLGKDALQRARSFDERHQLLSSTITSLDQRIGLSEKISSSTAAVSGKLREVDEQLQVSEIARSALAATEQTIMSIPYVSTGASWVTSAFGRVLKAAEDVSVMTKEKVEMAEFMQRQEMVDEFAKLYLDDSSPRVIVGAAPSSSSMDDRKL
ncbi:binding partner of ACD11 1-like [Zingiber officinale]|nr:binding partner of ACD11 1-like [Zingiber officinale]